MPLIGDLLTASQGLALDRTVGAAQEQFKTLTGIFDKYDVFERRNDDLGKSFNLTVAQAAKLGDALDKMADSFGIGGDALRAITTNLKGLIGPFATLNDLTSNSNKFGQSLYKTSNVLMKNYKLTGTVTNKLIQATHRTGQNLDIEIAKRIQITDLIETQMGGVELTSDALTDVANLTADLQMQYGRLPGQLELSVIKAKQLGISLSTLNSAGQNLLNIESSIGQEMEYELLTGRRLVDQDGESLTNKYRIATIQGKSSDQADIMYQMLEKEGKTLRENVFARQKFAELNGMDEATLSTMLQKYEAIQDLPGAKNLFKLSGDELMTQVATLTTNATTLAAVSEANDQRSTTDVLKDIEDQLTTGGIMAILDTNNLTGEAIAGAQRGMRIDQAKGVAGGLKGGMKAAYATSAINIAATTAADLATVAKKLAGGVISLAVGSQTISKTNPMPVTVIGTEVAPDFYSGPGGGRMLITPEGTFNLHNDDSVIGGTNLFGRKDSGTNNQTIAQMPVAKDSGTNNQAITQMAAAIVAAINNQTRELKADTVFGRGLTNSYYG